MEQNKIYPGSCISVHTPYKAFCQEEGPMTKILFLKKKPVLKRLVIDLIGGEHDQDLGPPFSTGFKPVGYWSSDNEWNAYHRKTGKVIELWGESLNNILSIYFFTGYSKLTFK